MTAEKIVLENGFIVLPDRVVSDAALLLDASTVVGLGAPGDAPQDATRVDVDRRMIAPGLVDIHMHGALGRSFNEGTREAFGTILGACAASGVTSVLATTATAPLEQLETSLATVRQWRQSPGAGAELLGAHVEGPYFASSQAGAQDPAHLRVPADRQYERLLAYADVIHIFTYAPELPGAPELTQRLTALGIVAAAGHSAAREEDLLPHFPLGLRHMIHLWSGQSTTVREGPWRKPGLLEVSLTRPDLTAEMIGDGKHLPPTLMKLAYQCIGPDRLCLISDATSGAGLPDGAPFRMGEMSYVVGDGVGMLLDGTAFAGSTTLLNQMVRVLIEQVDIPLVEAVRMASWTPARVIGVDNRKGSLLPGRDADLVVFEPDFRPWRVMVKGEWLPHGQ